MRSVILKTALSILLLSTTIVSQVPTITSFTPTSGLIGTSVTITGTNFNTIAANNVVYFGAVKANVTNANSTQLTVTAPTGATYAPITVTDTTTGLTAYSNASFAVTFASSRIIDATSFAGKVDFQAGTNPSGVTISDVDGDGKPDIIITNVNSNNISIFRNTSASGTFTTGSLAAKVDFATEAAPYFLAIDDVDGDGKQDIVATNFLSDSLSVIRNTSITGNITTGSFAEKVNFQTGANYNGVSIKDLDGDGKPDIVVAKSNVQGKISVFRNTSTTGSITTGSFASKVDFTTGGQNPSQVSIGDIDGDSKPDIVVNGNTKCSVFRNISTIGSITSESFAPNVDFTTGNGPVDIFDMDGDGKLDIVAVDQNTNTLSLFRNTSTAGSITYAPKVDFLTSPNPVLIEIGDIDGDGKPDIVVTNQNVNKVSIYRNQSTSGNIDGTALASKIEFSTGTLPAQVAIGDMDGDGKSDLVVTNSADSSVSVFRNTIPTPPSITSFSPISGPIGTSVTITGTNFNTTSTNNIVYFGAVKANVTNASTTELTVTVPTGATYAPITVTDTTTGLTAYSSKPFVVTFSSSQIIDVSSFASKVDFTAGSGPYTIAVGDIDGDGKPDVAVANEGSSMLSIFRNTGTGGSASFAAKVDFATGVSPRGVAIGDVDGDGKPDVVVTNNGGTTISVFRNTSTSGAITLDPKVDFTMGNGPNIVVIGDVDGDGKADLIVASEFSSGMISIFRNTGTNGTISFAAKVDSMAGSGPWGVALGDVDGDGKPDLVNANAGNNTISVFRNTGTSGSISLDTKVDFATGSYPLGVAIGDVDGDGKPDVVVTNYNGSSVSVFRNTSTAGSISLALKADFATGSVPAGIALGDLDGDGKADITTANYGSNTVSILKNTSISGTISLAAKVEFATGSSPVGVAIADIDGDGKPDLAATNQGSNSFSVLRNSVIRSLHVSSTGNNSNDGSAQFPLADIGDAMNKASAGDTIKIGA
ncbi:VCBS repeat-containing protein, partial [bacterium]|nr:VCBS repeat-containing protein [bacterium]